MVDIRWLSLDAGLIRLGRDCFGDDPVVRLRRALTLFQWCFDRQRW